MKSVSAKKMKTMMMKKRRMIHQSIALAIIEVQASDPDAKHLLTTGISQ
jgi:hypothetical protein